MPTTKAKVNTKKKRKSPANIKIWPELERSLKELGRSYWSRTTVVQCPVCLNTHVCNAAYPNWDGLAGCNGYWYIFDYAKGPPLKNTREEQFRTRFDVGPKRSKNPKHRKTRMRSRVNMHRKFRKKPETQAEIIKDPYHPPHKLY